MDVDESVDCCESCHFADNQFACLVSMIELYSEFIQICLSISNFDIGLMLFNSANVIFALCWRIGEIFRIASRVNFKIESLIQCFADNLRDFLGLRTGLVQFFCDLCLLLRLLQLFVVPRAKLHYDGRVEVPILLSCVLFAVKVPSDVSISLLLILLAFVILALRASSLRPWSLEDLGDVLHDL